METRRTVMEDPEDVGLRAVMGDRFRELQPIRKEKSRRPGEGLPGVLLWILILMIFGFWYRNGQMDSSAAIPAMVVCAFLGGCRMGKGR